MIRRCMWPFGTEVDQCERPAEWSAPMALPDGTVETSYVCGIHRDAAVESIEAMRDKMPAGMADRIISRFERL